MCAFNAKTETAKLPETRPVSCAQAERFKLTCFLLGNRCPPTVLVDWYLMRGCLHDEAAKMNVAAVLKQHLDGKLEKYKTWIIDPVAPNGDDSPLHLYEIVTPDFAEAYPEYWQEAIKALNNGRATSFIPIDPPMCAVVKPKPRPSGPYGFK